MRSLTSYDYPSIAKNAGWVVWRKAVLDTYHVGVKRLARCSVTLARVALFAALSALSFALLLPGILLGVAAEWVDPRG